MTEFIKASEITSSFFSEMLNVKNIDDFNKLIDTNKSNKNIIEKGGNKKKHKKKVKKKRNKKNKKKKQLFEMSIKELKEYVKNKK